jgi:hypothetical protein
LEREPHPPGKSATPRLKSTAEPPARAARFYTPRATGSSGAAAAHDGGEAAVGAPGPGTAAAITTSADSPPTFRLPVVHGAQSLRQKGFRPPPELALSDDISDHMGEVTGVLQAMEGRVEVTRVKR